MMDQRSAATRGCLLGMAVGDAMGYSVDKKSWSEICEAYGPNGLLGYDLANGSADVTSYTQLAVFVCNSLLLASTRGNPELYSRYLVLAVREWAKSQQFRANPERTHCWVAQVGSLRRRLCMDTQMLDALTRPTLGTPEAPVFRSVSPGALTGALAVGLCHDPKRMQTSQLLRLGTEAVAFTHGRPEAFLCGAFLSCAMAMLLQDPQQPLYQLFTAAMDTVAEAYADRYPTDTEKLSQLIQKALSMTRDPELSPLAAMTLLECTTAAECVAGAVYAATIHPANFDEAMIVSVNHSGRSCAVGALTGAFLGARLGDEALPEFYLESLECAPYLTELAQDLVDCRQVSRIFDDSWDQKYVQGLPTL
ncbi:MAG: ADP-ribosylglycohydrolase family protein [Oscillospiraceae bacterium]|nr:ADP-ribosylglycohydrolase family protein [Oscillospiraceae bacterium]